VSEFVTDLNRAKSWVLALWSVTGLVAPLLARACSTVGRSVEKATVTCSRVLLSVCGARVAVGEGDELHPSQVFSEGRKEGEYFRSFFGFDFAIEVLA